MGESQSVRAERFYRTHSSGYGEISNCSSYGKNAPFREGEVLSEGKQKKKGLGGLGSALGNVTEQVGEVAEGATEQVGEVAGGATEQVGEVTDQVGKRPGRWPAKLGRLRKGCKTPQARR